MLKTLNRLGRRTIKSYTASVWRLRTVFANSHHGAGRVVILGYHRVAGEDIAQAEREKMYGMVTSRDTFRQHLELIARHSDILSLDDAVAVLQGERAARRGSTVVTFDDGYLDFYEEAWPVLREMGLPAAVFLPTACIGGGILDHDRLYRCAVRAKTLELKLQAPLQKAGVGAEQIWQVCAQSDPLEITYRLNGLPLTLRTRVLECLDEFLDRPGGDDPNGFALLDWHLVRKLAACGVVFGAHTENHVTLTVEDQATAAREIARSKHVLEQKLGRPVRHFAYPTGAYNSAIREAVAKAGFVTGVTTERRVNRPGCDLLTLGRLCICEESTRGIGGRYSPHIARLRLVL